MMHGQVKEVTQRVIIQGQIQEPHGAPYLLCAGNLELGVANGAIYGATGKQYRGEKL